MHRAYYAPEILKHKSVLLFRASSRTAWQCNILTEGSLELQSNSAEPEACEACAHVHTCAHENLRTGESCAHENLRTGESCAHENLRTGESCAHENLRTGVEFVTFIFYTVSFKEGGI